MSGLNSKPDLEDSINVSEAHGRVMREAAATAREKRIADNGREPISLWVLAGCLAPVLVAGIILGSGGNYFGYKSTFREGYIRDTPKGVGGDGPAAKEAL